MNTTLSIKSMYHQVKHDFITDAKKYALIFSIQGVLLAILYLLLFLFIPTPFFSKTMKNQQQFALIREFFMHPSGFFTFMLLLLSFLESIISWMFQVGFLNFIYTLKTRSISLSVQDFFNQITFKKVVRVFGVYVIRMSLIVTILLLIDLLPIMPIKIIFSPVTMSFSTWPSLTWSSLLFFLFVTTFVSIFFVPLFMIAPFVVFEPNISIIVSIRESYARTRGHVIRVALIWLAMNFISTIGELLIFFPFIILFGASISDLFMGRYTSVLLLSFKDRGFLLFTCLILILSTYVFYSFQFIIFRLINGEIYKRLTKKQENNAEFFPDKAVDTIA
jgi:hypothetical protein